MVQYILVYKKVIKPILFQFSPDTVHNLVVSVGRRVQVVAPARWLMRKLWRRDSKQLSQTIAGIDFKNPIGLSAGFDKNIELTPLMESVGFGFETGGSVTLSPRRGNVRPWFHRLPSTEGIVVHAGLANRGVVRVSKAILRNRRRIRGMPLFVSVAVVARSSKETPQDAIIDAKNTILYILQRKLAQAIEINISCPNAGDDQPFTRPELFKELLIELDKIERDVPFFVKMPNMPEIRRFDALLRTTTEHNIQGVTIANLVKDRERVQLEDELPEEVKGGISGRPARVRSTALIQYAYSRYGDRLVIIGVGGVFSAEHAYEKIRAGASLVGMVTGIIFEGPQVVGQINSQLMELLKRDGFQSVTEAIGVGVEKSK